MKDMAGRSILVGDKVECYHNGEAFGTFVVESVDLDPVVSGPGKIWWPCWGVRVLQQVFLEEEEEASRWEMMAP